MTAAHDYIARVRPMWQSMWPAISCIIFALLAVTRLLPAGYPRAVVSLPILFLVPGSLTVSVAFGARKRPQGKIFYGYATILSVLWSVFISLVLYMLGVPITAANTYWGLLAVCAVLAVGAEAQLLVKRPHLDGQTRAFRAFDSGVPNSSGNSDEPTTLSQYAAVFAIVAGLAVLVGGVYFYEHLPSPAEAGYTEFAWSSVKGTDIAVGPAGAKLYYEIVHDQPSTSRFRLTAAWAGNSVRPLSTPVTLIIGPNRTIRGSLSIPRLAGNCPHRIVLTLVETDQVDPLTEHQPTWSINANVNNSRGRQDACAK